MELFFNRILAWCSDKLIVHSESCKEVIIQKIGKFVKNKTIIVQHGNYCGCYENNIERQIARDKLGIPVNSFVFLSLGYIRKYKGIEKIIQSFQDIKDCQLALLIAGNPAFDFESELSRMCRQDGRIRLFLKRIPDQEIQIYMNAADVFVCSFENIFTSGSVVLAMSFAKPIIAPRLGAVADYVDDEKGGILYNAEDGVGLQRAMLSMCDVDIESMGKYNYQKISLSTWDRIAKEINEIYRSFINEGKI